MIYRVILTANGIYKKTLHTSRTADTSFIHYHSLIEANKKIKFPKRFINTNEIKPVQYQICVTKPTEPTDIFRQLRDDYGRVYYEKPIGDWTILASEKYEVEESFWILGMNPKKDRPIIDDVIKKLMLGSNKNISKQIIVVHNKLVIYNEEQFDMIICKCKKDAQRLHHTLAAIAKKQRIKSLVFMGTATPATISRMYNIIREKTGWTYNKVKRTTTRP